MNAILESIEAKPIGTELDDGEPWNEKSKNQANVGVTQASLIIKYTYASILYGFHN